MISSVRPGDTPQYNPLVRNLHQDYKHKNPNNMSNNNPNTEKWHRLEQVIKWTGLSINAFALHIGLKRSENLYQIKKGNNGISHDLAALITAKYPVISKGWLLTGEGEMMIDPQQTGTATGIPCYGMDAIEAVEMLERCDVEQQPPTIQPQFYIHFPPLKHCDLATLSLSDAMQPEIPAGSYVLLRRQQSDELLPGSTCLILSDTFKGIRIVRQSSQADELLLLPRNSNAYDPIHIKRDAIHKLFVVEGIIIKKIL